MESAYKRWTWEKCAETILSLKHRLGFGERLWILGFELLDDGRLVDPFHGTEVFDPSVHIPPSLIPSHYSAVPEMYCILSTYAMAEEKPLHREWVSLAAFNRLQRSDLKTEDCLVLLGYIEKDYRALQDVEIGFFGKQLEGGDFSFIVWPLPCFPVRFVLWQGDDEMPCGGSLLLDPSAVEYLQDLVEELAWLTVWRLRNILDPKDRWGYHGLVQDR